jgi:hypothetical protein
MSEPIDGGYEELRIHGVAGTPPESMLQLEAVPDEPPAKDCGELAGEPVQIYRSPPDQPNLRAFSWSSLTSGSAVMALWMLLLPYMLANVAGWAMLPLTRRAGVKRAGADRSLGICLIALFVRLGGALVTAIFALALVLTLVDLVGYQVLAKARDWQAGPATGLAATALAILALFAATHVRRSGTASFWEKDVVDPVGYAWLDDRQDLMWNSPGIILRLRRLHLGVAWGIAALVAMHALDAVEGVEMTATDRAVTGLALVASLFSVVFLSLVSLSSGRDLRWTNPWIRHAAWMLSFAAVAGAVWRMALVDLTEPKVAGHLPVVRGAAAWSVLALLALVVGAVATSRGFADRDRVPAWASFNLPSLMLTAATVAGIFGIGLAAQVAKLFGETECLGTKVDDCQPILGPIVDWISVGFTWMLTVLLWVLTYRFVRAVRFAGPGAGRFMRAVRRMTDNISAILATLAIIGASATTAGLIIGAAVDFEAVRLPGWAETASTVAFFLPFVLGAAAVFVRLSRLAKVVAATATALLVVATVGFDASFEVPGLEMSIPPSSFLSLARLLAITLPTGLLLTRVLSSFRNRQERKSLAIVWDLGNFWPRWFHPFAPPTYSDVAVKRLRTTMDEHLRTGPVLLAPHSQGSIISAAAVAATDPGLARRMSYLTYGSPVSRLYAQAFPAVFSRELIGSLCERLESEDGRLRWRNLYRPTDPIGGKVMAEPPGVPDAFAAAAPSVDVEVPAVCGRSHSDYPKEPTYATARTELLGMLDGQGERL